MGSSTLVALIAAPLLGQSLRISSGLSPYQVLQRDGSGSSSAQVSGSASGLDGQPVEFRTGRGNWQRAATVQNGQWTATVTLPVGGPYTVQFRAGRAQVEVASVLVGDIWMLAGQSNMQGVGNLIDVHPPDPRVHVLDMIEERWQVAREPLHNLVGAVDRVHWRLNEQKQPERLTGERLAQFLQRQTKGAGLGLPFGAAYARETGVPVGLLPCAHGGTSMDQWDPARWDRSSPGDSLYGSCMRRLAVAGGKLKGILWYQGESDANPAAAPLFAARFEQLVAAFRRDTGEPNLPFYYVQLGRHVSTNNIESWNAIQLAQLAAERTIPNTAMVAAVDTELDDAIHVSTTDLKRLGANLALLAAGKAAKGPRPVSAVLQESQIQVTFEGSNGPLMSAGRVAGFTLHGPGGEPLAAIYKAVIDPVNAQRVVLHVQGIVPDGATVRYGYGKDPYVNLRDARGFGVPVFTLPVTM